MTLWQTDGNWWAIALRRAIKLLVFNAIMAEKRVLESG